MRYLIRKYNGTYRYWKGNEWVPLDEIDEKSSFLNPVAAREWNNSRKLGRGNDIVAVNFVTVAQFVRVEKGI